MSNINLEENNDEKKKAVMFQLDQLSERERVSLFGEPTKCANDLFKRINPLATENAADEEIFKRKSNKLSIDDVSEESTNHISLRQKIKKHLQLLVISSNNNYKSTWDFFLLLIICYNCMIVCY